MATIVLLEHRLQEGLNRPCLAYVFADRWRANGHRVLVHYGPENPPAGDVAVLHVDMTVVPEEYRSLVSLYPRVINGAVFDIAKRKISENIVSHPAGWPGPVIVKTNANDSGRPELRLRQRAEAAGAAGGVPAGPLLPTYPIYASAAEVPDAFWGLDYIVEKFLPERDARGYYLRICVFFGDRERNVRYRSLDPVIKSRNAFDAELIPVPDEMRAWRKRLGFDYGKFDYVLNDGRAILIDANRTPSAPHQLAGNPELLASYHKLAEGIAAFLR